MKKLILFLIIIFAGLSAFGQLDTTNIGTGANTGTGESIRSAFLKVNRTIRQVNTNTDSLKLKLNKASASVTNWNTAYADRLKWDGGSTGLTAATGRTSLGGTTAGQALFTLTNPSAITFLRINADNTVTALSAANFKTALSLTASDVGLGNVTNRIDSLVIELNDTIDGGTVYRELADTINYSFQVGLGLAGDTACFRKAYVLASFNSLVSDTIVVDSVNYVAIGTSPDIDVQMYFDVNFNDATPTAVCTSSVTVTSTTTGNGTTSFSNAQIPPGRKVWFRLTENTTQPKVLSGTVFYHVLNRSY